MAGIKGRSGRKTKTEEQKVLEALAPYEEQALQALEMGLKEGAGWAVRLYFDYYYTKPQIQIAQVLPEVSLPTWFFEGDEA